MSRRRGAIVPGLVLIVIGAWLLADQLGVRLPRMEALWPGLIVLAGLAFLGQALVSGRREGGLVFVGVCALLTGAFFFLFTLNIRLPIPPLRDGARWDDMAVLWPVFPAIGGMGFLGSWLIARERGLWFPALVALAVGAVGIGFTLGLVGPAVAAQAAKLWPLVIILAGFWMMFRYLRGR